jgi:hypothetical protein
MGKGVGGWVSLIDSPLSRVERTLWRPAGPPLTKTGVVASFWAGNIVVVRPCIIEQERLL